MSVLLTQVNCPRGKDKVLFNNGKLKYRELNLPKVQAQTHPRPSS